MRSRRKRNEDGGRRTGRAEGEDGRRACRDCGRVGAGCEEGKGTGLERRGVDVTGAGAISFGGARAWDAIVLPKVGLGGSGW